MKTTISLALGLMMLVGSAHAVTLQSIGPVSSDTLFNTEIKRDKNIHNNGQRGHDVFLRNQNWFIGPSKGFNFGASGSEYDWSIAYDGNIATLKFENITRQVNVWPDGDWNAFDIRVKADDSKRFKTATTTVQIDTVNGQGLVNPAMILVTDGFLNETLAVSDAFEFTSLSGTVRFDFDLEPGAKGSPNSRLSFGFKGLEIDPALLPTAVDDAGAAAVPVPGGLVLLGSVVAATDLWQRRRKQPAKA